MSKRAAKKQSILQAAIEGFSNGSFKNSSISEIAKRANVVEGTIYQYFKNKEDLFFSFPIQKTIEFTEEFRVQLYLRMLSIGGNNLTHQPTAGGNQVLST